MKEMKFTALLTSRLITHIDAGGGIKTPIKLENENDIVTNIKKYAPKRNRLVIIANDASANENNDERAKILYKSFSLTHLNFEEKIVIDNRNYKDAHNLILNADMVILWGGRIMCQMQFFKKIKLKKILSDYTGLVVGISAGTMNMCNRVCNFPEEPQDLGQPLITKGLSFCNEYIIPHCDGSTYPSWTEMFDTYKDYILPFSYKHDLICIPDYSYILLNQEGMKFCGNSFLLRKGEVYKKV